MVGGSGTSWNTLEQLSEKTRGHERLSSHNTDGARTAPIDVHGSTVSRHSIHPDPGHTSTRPSLPSSSSNPFNYLTAPPYQDRSAWSENHALLPNDALPNNVARPSSLT